MGFDLDAHRLAEQRLPERFGRGIFLVEEERSGHGAVDALDAQSPQRQMEHGDVAEPDHPFGVLAQPPEVDERQQAHRAVTPAVGDDSLDRPVVDHRLQVCGALLVGPGEIGLFAVGAVGAEFHMQAPRFEPLTDFRRVGLQRQFAAGATMPTVSPRCR